MSTALTTEHPPVAGALREQPKGQDPPRKQWDRSQCRLRQGSLEPSGSDGSVTVRSELTASSQRSLTAPLRLCYAFCYGSVPANPEIRLIRVTIPVHRPEVLPVLTSRCFGLPLALPPLCLGATTASRLLCGQTPSTVPGAAGWPPTAQSAARRNRTRRLMRTQQWGRPAGIGRRLKARSSGSQERPSR